MMNSTIDISFTHTTRPPNRHATYNASDKGKARRKRYRHDRSKHETDASYLSRPFVMWDGEGITLEDGSHRYVMLAHSEGGYLANPQGLRTMDIFRFIVREHAKHPDAIHVIYGGSYDFNMWLSDVPQHTLEGIYSHDYYRYGPVTIQWRRGKSFYLRYDADDIRAKKGVTIYDVVSFFQCSFVKACDQYLGDRFAHRDMIVKNKALRSSFTLDDIPEVKQYNQYELDNGVALMEELRARLNAVTLRPKRWDGPGAIAAALLTRERVKDAMTPTPEPVAEAARYAYAGGRFEVVQYGAVRAPAYEYDVNSAYPHALRNVPNLRRGEWVQRFDADISEATPEAFTLWHVRFTGSDFRLPQPLFWRSGKGNIVYPGDHTFYGWYWSPDVVAAREYVERYGGAIEVTSVWEYREDNPLDRPFAFIPELYHQRQLLKAKGDGAHVGIKLGLNSLYGKLAQQVGARYNDDKREWRLPPFHQMEYAGYVTSTCRSMVYRAAIDNLRSVIAYETDALFTTEPLDLPIGTALGEWEATEFDDLTYVQSGVYFGTVAGKPVAKTRGVNLGSLTREHVEERMQERRAEDRHATAELTQFITAGQALQGRFWEWRRWITSEKKIELEPQGKRVPLPGRFGEWNRTFAARVPDESHSAAFPVLWINPDAGMVELEELRNMGTAEFYDLGDGYA